MPVRTKVVFWISLLTFSCLFFVAPGAKAQSVVFNEVLINGPGACDGACTPSTEEWIELYNPSCSPVDISCYRISDGDFAITIPSGSVIPAQGYFLIGSSNSPVGIAALDLNLGTCGCTTGPVSAIGVLTNGTEQLILTNSTGILQNAISWGGGQALPATFSASALGTCSATTLNLPSAGPSYEDIGTNGGANGCTKARSTDGGLTWVERCTTAISPKATNNTSPLPVVTVSPAAASVCQGQSTTLSASGAFTDFSWSPAAGLSSATGSSVVATPTATTTYTVTGINAAGCLSASSATVMVTVLPSPAITTTASAPMPICAGQSVSITASGATTYSWNTGQTGSIITVSPAANTNYTVTGTTGTCSATQTFLVTVSPLPVVSVSAASTTLCSGASTTLTASGATSYSWSTGQTGSVITVTPASTTSYSVTGTANGCTSAPQSISITVNQTPATPAASNNGPLCAGATLNLSATSTSAGVGYSWTGPGITSANANQQNPVIPNITTAQGGTYSVFAFTSSCSSAVATTTVVVNPSGNAAFSYGASSFCKFGPNPFPATAAGTTGTFTSTPNGPVTAPGLILNSSTGEINLTLSGAGSYTITFTTSGICSVQSTQTVSIVAPANACFNYPAQSYCQNAFDPTPSSCSGTGASFGTFSSTPFGLSINASSGVIDLSNSLAGSYWVFNTIAASGPCGAVVDSAEVEILPVPETPLATSNSPICAGNTLLLTITNPDLLASYVWTGPGTPPFSSTVQNPSISNAQPSNSGVYSVTATIGSCSSAAGTTSAVVNPVPAQPVAANNGPVCAGSAIQLSVTNPNAAATYTWTGPGTPAFTSNLQNPQIPNATPNNAGTYSVTAGIGTCTSAVGTTSVTVITTPTPTVTPAGPLTICQGNSVVLTANIGVAPAIYGINWQIGGVDIPGANSFTYAVTATGQYTARLFHLNNSCSAVSQPVLVTVTLNPITPTASSNSPVCSGATLQLSATNASPGATFTWTGPGSPAFSSNIQNPTITGATPANSGVYTLVTSLNGCSSPAVTTSVVVNPQPAPASPSSNSPVCEGQQLVINAGGAPAGATYSWIRPDGTTFTGTGATTSSLVINNASIAAHNGNWTVYVIQNGCVSAPATTFVGIIATPPTPAASNNSPVCAGTLLQFNASGSSPTATYSWSRNGSNVFFTQNPQIPAATAANAGTWTVIASEGTCSSAASVTTVVVNPQPAAPVVSSNSPVCAGQALNLSASSSAPGSQSYSWIFPNGNGTSTQQYPVLSPATTSMAGTYTVTVTANGCTSAPAFMSVSISPAPAPPTIITNSPVCQGNSLTLSTTLVPGATYTWTTPSGGQLLGQTINITNAQLNNSGTYTLVTPGASGCGAVPATATVVVNATPPAPAIISNSPLCTGQTLSLSVASSPGATYTWVSPTGIIYTGPSVTIPNVTIANAGQYTLTVTSAAGCVSSPGYTTVVVNPNPAITVLTATTPICEGDPLQLSAFGNFQTGTTFLWTGPGNPTYSTTLQNPVRANATPAYSGIYTFTVTSGTCTDTDTVSAQVVPRPPAPVITATTPVCAGDTINFSSNVTGTWFYNWVNPQGLSFSTLPNPVIANANATHNGTYTLFVTNGIGCTSLGGTFTVQVNNIPVVNAGSNSTICEGETLQLSATTVPSATYLWSGPLGYSNTQANPAIPLATASMSGVYTVAVTLNGCTKEDTVNVTVSPKPDTPVPFTNATTTTPICEGQALILSVQNPIAGNYSWTGPVSFSSADTVLFPSTVSMQGNYSVQVSVGGCVSDAGNILVSIKPAPVVTASAVVPSDTVICRNQVPVNIRAQGSLLYQWSAADPSTAGIPSPSDLNQISVSPTATTTYTVIGSNANGCSDTAYVTITIVEPEIPDAGPDLTGTCTQDSIALSAAAPATGTGQWSIISGTGGSFENNTNPATLFRGETGQTYSLVWTVTTPLCGPVSDTMEVTFINEITTPQVTGDSACPSADPAGTVLTLAATGSEGTYHWYADASLTEPALSTDSIFNVSITQTTTFYVVAKIGDCASEAVPVEAIINDVPEISAGLDVVITRGEATILNATGGTTYNWSPSAGLSFTNVQSPAANPLETTTYTVTTTNEAGCEASDTVVVTVIPVLLIPNGFTPNGDGINDVWEIDALTLGHPDCKVTIFNRWGGIVFTSRGYKTPWNGTIKGDKLQTATFYYVIEVKPGDEPISGSVTILR